MSIQVLIEPLANNGFRATSGEPLAVSVEAPTREEALAKVKERLQARLKNGAELVPIQLNTEPNPWTEFAGMFDPNDPLVKAWKRQMARNRRKKDAEPDIP
jgi:hypothetical protein